MKFAIIAAGEGSRLASEGVNVCKPLVRCGGETLIGRLCRIFAEDGAEEIVIVTRPEVASAMEGARLRAEGTRVKVIARLTPSSLHSFGVVAQLLEGEAFCLTTVDTVFREEEFASYIREFRNLGEEWDGLWAVTPFIDDEKPLYVEALPDGEIVSFSDVKGGAYLVSGGIYCMKPSCLPVLRECLEGGVSRMRNFQRRLIERGRRLKAYEFRKIVDVDHARDIEKAEEFLAQGGGE